MTRILVVNPNTTPTMTATIAHAARAAAAPGTQIIAVTSSMGPVSIEVYYDEAFAVPGLLRAIREQEAAGAQAAVVACFDDTGVDAARAMSGIPVIGICEAALATAGFLAKRFTIVTTMKRSRLPIEELVHRYGMGGRARVRAADISVLSLDDPRSGAGDKLRREIALAITEDHAEAIILGCAGMADLARTLQAEYNMPVVDGVGAAVKHAEALIMLGLSTSKQGAYAYPVGKPYSGLMAEFAPQSEVLPGG